MIMIKFIHGISYTIADELCHLLLVEAGDEYAMQHLQITCIS